MGEPPLLVKQLSAMSTASMCEVAERNPYPRTLFRCIDTNNDGKIDANDLRAFYLATDIDDHSLAVR
jgi:Ca2+-binding EF-hand superfamily protein